MKIVRIEVVQEYDETGELERFTWDLFPIIETSRTLHLADDGTPKVGSVIRTGEFVVAKIARTKYYDPNAQPTSLEIHGWSFEKLKAGYGRMWKDTSVYATAEAQGKVVDVQTETVDGRIRVIVEIDTDVPLG